jgi:hypothetical protein
MLITGIPKPRFNIYTQYTDATFVFSNDDDASLFPSSTELYTLLAGGITGQYLRNVVRVLPGFEEVVEAAMKPLR